MVGLWEITAWRNVESFYRISKKINCAYFAIPGYRSKISHSVPSLHGAHEGEGVGVFEAAAGGEALGDAGEAAIFPAQQFGEVIGGGFAFDVGAEGEDDFEAVGGVVDAAEESRDMEVFGRDAVEG